MAYEDLKKALAGAKAASAASAVTPVAPVTSGGTRIGGTKIGGVAPSTTTTPTHTYGSNVTNFDPNNQQHIALANAGEQWWTAKGAGDTEGMKTAAQLGETIRSGLQGSTFDKVKGLSTLGQAPNQFTETTTVIPTPLAAPSSNSSSIFTPGSFGGYDPAAQEKAYLEMQLASLGGQSEAARKAAQYGIDQNKAYLQEQLSSLNTQEAMDKQSAQELQNRRGGFYSGGLDYQLGGIDRGYTQAESALGRDIGSRNQQLIDQYGTQANAIAQQIQTLQFNQPDILKQRIQDWINNERNYGLNYANQFGNLAGQQTLGAQQQQWNQAMDLANLTGQYNGERTLQGQQADLANKTANWNAYLDVANLTGNLGQGPTATWGDLITRSQSANTPLTLQGQQFNLNKAQQAWENAFNTKSFEQDMQEAAASRGLQWASLDQRQKEFIADSAFREKQYQQELGSASGKRVSDSIDQLQGLYVTRDPSTGQISVTNPTALRSAIIAKGLSDNETDEILTFFNLPTN